jgi:hypothetical protein
MKEYIISILRANAIAVLLILPIGIIELTPFILIHGIEGISIKGITFSGAVFGVLRFALAVTLGVLAHELLHGIGWLIFTKKGWRSISFGIKWEYMTPYCHCSEPLKPFAFVIGAVLPLLVLGILPVVLSYYSGSFTMWFYGFFFTIAAGGDIIAIWMLRKVKKGQLVLDHPNELGFIAVDTETFDKYNQ